MADKHKKVGSKAPADLMKARAEASKKLNAANKGKEKPDTDY